MKQEGERGDENVSLHALVGLMIDRPHVDDVLEVGEGTFDFGKFFVEAYRVDCGQIGLFGLNDVFALVSLLAREVDGAACSGKKSNSPSSPPDAINRPLTR